MNKAEYETVAGLAVRKSPITRKVRGTKGGYRFGKTLVKSAYYFGISIADRQSKHQRGLLFQHLQQRKDGSYRKLGANFFVPQNDVPRFLRTLRALTMEHGNEFGPISDQQISSALALSMEETVKVMKEEIEQLEARLNRTSKERTEEREKLEAEIAARDNDVAKISRQLIEIQQRRETERVIVLEKRLPILKQQVQDLRNLIQNGQEIAKKRGVQQETLFQEFLAEHFWMFGSQYISAEPKPQSGGEHIPDLLLQRADGFNDVVELENPTDDLFVNIKKRPEQSKALKEALAQTMDYVDVFGLNYEKEIVHRGFDTYKPNGIIVIGRWGEKVIERKRRQLNSYLHGIEIWTYDDLVRNAEGFIALLEGKSRVIQNTNTSTGADMENTPESTTASAEGENSVPIADTTGNPADEVAPGT